MLATGRRPSSKIGTPPVARHAAGSSTLIAPVSRGEITDEGGKVGHRAPGVGDESRRMAIRVP